MFTVNLILIVHPWTYSACKSNVSICRGNLYRFPCRFPLRIYRRIGSLLFVAVAVTDESCCTLIKSYLRVKNRLEDCIIFRVISLNLFGPVHKRSLTILEPKYSSKCD